MTSDSDRAALLALAREAIVAHLSGRPAPASDSGAAARPGGAFVTIHHHSDLRGCIGHLETNEPIGRVIVRVAVAAAAEDPRFPPVTASELADLAIELSLLGPLEPIVSVEDIDVGRHGLVVEMGSHRGLLLPQVATEWGWDRRTFVEHTCRKAGLPRDAWRHGARLFRFEAEVFGEETGAAPDFARRADRAQ